MHTLSGYLKRKKSKLKSADLVFYNISLFEFFMNILFIWYFFAYLTTNYKEYNKKKKKNKIGK